MNTARAIDGWQEEYGAWAQFFAFVASFYLREPAEPLFADCEAVGRVLTEHLPGADFVRPLLKVREDDPAMVRQEYFDLFFVPTSEKYCSPYEALQGKGNLGNTAPEETGRLFVETGFDPSLLPGIPPYLKSLGRSDFVGFELYFMANMFRAATTAKDEAEAEKLFQTAADFYQKHFASWAGEFGNKVAVHAATNYFKGCGLMTVYLAGVLTEEKRS